MKNSFTRPGFIAAAVVIALVLALGIGLLVSNSNKPAPSLTPLPSDPSEPAVATTRPAATATVVESPGACPASDDSGRKVLPVAPPAVWKFQGTTAYPTSADFGPWSTDSGFRKCFKHSVEGAVFAAANAAVHATDPSNARAWFEYMATGPGREELLKTPDQGSSGGARVNIVGYRVLSYTGDEARIDVAVRVTTGGQQVVLSMVYSLVWQSNDWRLLIINPTKPLDIQRIPDVAGYVQWSA